MSKKHIELVRKALSVFASLMLLIQSASPYFIAAGGYAYAASQVQAQEEVTPTEEPTPEVTEEPTPEVTTEPTVVIEEITPTEEVPTATPAPTIVEETPSEEESSDSDTDSDSSSDSDNKSTEPTSHVTPTPTDTEFEVKLDGEIQTEVIMSNQCLANSLNGCAAVSTDKPDYAPTEVVILTGTDFQPDTDYRVVIYSHNSPAVEYEAVVRTNSEGDFEVSYQLDGLYRPNYFVDVYDMNDVLVAATTFTDADTGYSVPSATHTPNDWDTNTVSNVISSNNVYASDNDEDEQGYSSFNLPAIPAGSTINGIDLLIEAKNSDSSGCQLETRLSWDNGTSNTAIKTASLTGSDTVYAIGGVADTWGRTWSATDFTNANFVVKVKSDDVSGNSCDNNALLTVDQIQVRVTYAAPVVTPTPTAGPTGAPVGGQTVQNSCIDELVDGPINCTANDVSIANVTNIQVLDDGCTSPSDTVTFKADWEVQSTATQRYDVGLWFATGGQPSALSGSCSISTLPYAPVPPWYNYDNNVCGDISSAAPVNPQLTLTVACIPDENNYLNLPYCTTWEQNAGSCGGPLDTVPGAPSKCNCEDGFSVPITVPEFAEIEVVKDLNPSNDTGEFNLQVNSETEAACVGDTGTTGSVSVAAGTNEDPGATHTVGETACEGTAASNYSSSISCVYRGTNTVVASGSGTGPLNVPVNPDDDIVCTITNTVNQGSLKIVKNTTGDNGSFDYTVSGPTSSTPSVTTTSNTGTTGFFSVNTGSYDISETVPEGWEFDSAECIDGQGAQIGTPSGSAVNNVEVGPNDQITCTFNNTRLRDITACKYEDVTGNGRDENDPMLSGWDMTLQPGNLTQTTDENGCTTFTGLSPNDYTVTETLQSNWSNITPLSQDVDLTGAQNETIYFGNFACSTVSGSKWEDLNGNGQLDEGEPAVANWPIDLVGDETASTTTDENGNYSFTVCEPDSYTVNEGTLDANVWYQTYPAFEYYDVVVESGESYEDKDFGNARYASIGGFKYRDNDGDGTLDANDLTDTLSGWVIRLYQIVDDVVSQVTSDITDVLGQYSFTGLFAGRTYFVVEEQQSGWTQTYGPMPTPTPFTVSSGQTLGIDFANFQNVSVEVCKMIDDDEEDEVKPYVYSAGWPVALLVDGKVADEATTNENGCYTWENLGPGHEYGVQEGEVDGYIALGNTTHSFGQAESGSKYSHTFYNQGRGTITVVKFVDTDGDLQTLPVSIDDVEGLEWTWKHNDGTDYASGDTVNVPAHIGQHISESSLPDYDFGSLVCETDEEGEATYETDDGEAHVTVNPGENVTCTYTNIRQRGNVTVHKFHDLDANGLWEEEDSEPLLEGWTMNLGAFSQDTASDGKTTFTVPTGEYELSEVIQEGWYQSNMYCDGDEGLDNDNSHTVNVTAESDLHCYVGNYQRGEVIVTKYIDNNGDGLLDTEQDTKQGGWDMILFDEAEEDAADPRTQTTGEDGTTTFEDVELGRYSLGETQKDGYKLIMISCGEDDRKRVELDQFSEGFLNSTVNRNFFTVQSGETVQCSVLNQPTDPELVIEKTNNAAGVLTSGDSVVYTLRLTVGETGGPSKNTVVTDVTPEGFAYQAGSWSATKNGVPFAVSEPTYASPGDWSLGDLMPGDVVEMTYTARIDDEQDSGLYPDLAWAVGESVGGSELLALAGTDGNIGEENFVGTDVEIAVNTQDTKRLKVERKKEEGEVLGASTLPATGALTMWLIIGGLLAAGGALSMMTGMKLKKNGKKGNNSIGKLIAKLTKGMSIFALMVLLAGANGDVYAVTPTISGTSVRIETPADTNLDEFKVNFVALDIENRAIEVTCFQKGPGDAGFTQYDSTKSLQEGGDSRFCTADETVLDSDGTYQFYVEATPNGGSTLTSATVTADVNTEGPRTPTNYSKKKLNSCKYEIRFRTGDDDGRTAKVEVYRSDVTSFTADAGSRVHEQAAGSNELIVVTNEVSDCNKTYYYGVRAFSASGVGSGIVGDSVTITVGGTTTSSSTSQAAGAGTGGTELGAIPVEGAEGSEDGAAGEEGATDEEGTQEEGDGETPAEEEVLGAQSGFLDNLMSRLPEPLRNPWLLGGALVLIVLAILGYVIRKRNS